MPASSQWSQESAGPEDETLPCSKNHRRLVQVMQYEQAPSKAGPSRQGRPNKVEDCDFALCLDDDNEDEEREMDPYKAQDLLTQGPFVPILSL